MLSVNLTKYCWSMKQMNGKKGNPFVKPTLVIPSHKLVKEKVCRECEQVK